VRNHVLDANALIRLYRNTDGADTVQKLFEQAKAGLTELSISAVNLAEVACVLSKYFRRDVVRQHLILARATVKTMPVDDQVALDVAQLRIRYKLGLADCFAAELAMRLGATLVTADPEFGKLGKLLKVLALPRHVGSA
jgi:predicted nucleic acid-binding protein